MKNMIMHQTKAMTIQVPSTRSNGCFHHSRSVGGSIALMRISPELCDAFAYFATGMVRMSMTPQRT
jgi:hypothetical protein